MTLSRLLAVVLCALLHRALAQQAVRRPDPPEIVALTSVSNNFKPQFIDVGLGPALLDQITKWTWRPRCPVSPEQLTELRVSYWDFGAKPQFGEVVVNRALAPDLQFIFRRLFEHGFLIERIAPVETFSGSDDASMQANNTSAFNCRDVTGQPGKFSNHSWGRAIDINPLTNPMILHGKPLPPEGARFTDRTEAHPGSILPRSFAVKLFESRGWVWGGIWTSPDYQHFEKPEPPDSPARK